MDILNIVSSELDKFNLTEEQLSFISDAANLVAKLSPDEGVYVEWIDINNGAASVNITWDTPSETCTMVSLTLDTESSDSDRPTEVSVEIFGTPEEDDEGELVFTNGIGFWLDTDGDIEVFHSTHGTTGDDHMLTKQPKQLSEIISLFKYVVNKICLNGDINRALGSNKVFTVVEKDMPLYAARKALIQSVCANTMIEVI